MVRLLHFRQPGGRPFTDFYPPGNDTLALIAYLSTFAVGFIVRPFGALFFGRIGDLVGRKYAFLVTLSIMGGATALIGLLPTYKTAGWFAPIALLLIRVLQGLALGGEYGGAAVYVAEHVPDNKRGFYTSFIQITATSACSFPLMVILGTQSAMTKEQFADWGWRIPFLLSIILVSISLYIRLKMRESPIFSHIKSVGHDLRKAAEGSLHRVAEPEARADLLVRRHRRPGRGLVHGAVLRVVLPADDSEGESEDIAISSWPWRCLLGMPFFTLFGALSDRIGRKWMMMAACLLAVVSYIPIYKQMQVAAGNNVVTVRSTTNKVTGAISLTPFTIDATGQQVPAKEAANPNIPMLVLLVFIQVIFVCMIYGPIAAYLVEAFPAKIRYTSLSLPYHIGNGVFGGLLPLIGLTLCARTGNIYAGLYYPMIVAAITLVAGSLLLKETHGTLIWDEYNQAKRTSPTAD